MVCPVATFVIVTTAPWTIAPEGSLTVPTMLPVPTVVWADKDWVVLKSSTTAANCKAKELAALSAEASIAMPQVTAPAPCGESGPCNAGRSEVNRAWDLP